MEIIVKKYGDSQRFVPHHNRELGKTYHDKRTYLSDIKKSGLEPYKPGSKRTEPKPYQRSKWANEMIENIHERHGRKPEGRFLDELSKRGYNQQSADKARKIANDRSY